MIFHLSGRLKNTFHISYWSFVKMICINMWTWLMCELFVKLHRSILYFFCLFCSFHGVHGAWCSLRGRNKLTPVWNSLRLDQYIRGAATVKTHRCTSPAIPGEKLMPSHLKSNHQPNTSQFTSLASNSCTQARLKMDSMLKVQLELQKETLGAKEQKSWKGTIFYTRLQHNWSDSNNNMVL